MVLNKELDRGLKRYGDPAVIYDYLYEFFKTRTLKLKKENCRLVRKHRVVTNNGHNQTLTNDSRYSTMDHSTAVDILNSFMVRDISSFASSNVKQFYSYQPLTYDFINYWGRFFDKKVYADAVYSSTSIVFSPQELRVEALSNKFDELKEDVQKRVFFDNTHLAIGSETNIIFVDFSRNIMTKVDFSLPGLHKHIRKGDVEDVAAFKKSIVKDVLWRLHQTMIDKKVSYMPMEFGCTNACTSVHFSSALRVTSRLGSRSTIAFKILRFKSKYSLIIFNGTILYVGQDSNYGLQMVGYVENDSSDSRIGKNVVLLPKNKNVYLEHYGTGKDHSVRTQLFRNNIDENTNKIESLFKRIQKDFKSVAKFAAGELMDDEYMETLVSDNHTSYRQKNTKDSIFVHPYRRIIIGSNDLSIPLIK